jgi:hypothetical protein
MGFEMLEGDGAAGGVSVLHHYDGDRKDKVVFAKEIGLSSHTFYRDPSAES